MTYVQKESGNCEDVLKMALKNDNQKKTKKNQQKQNY